MIPIIEDAVLGSDLDGASYNLLNVNLMDPPPSNLVTMDDVRLTDVREPIPGSVTNLSVASDAAIDQSKLNLNGLIPPAWLGASAGMAAPGDQAEYVINKNVPGGYAGLDSTGKIPATNLPDAVGLATVTSIGISLPPELYVASGPNPITTTGTWNIRWHDLGGAAWFGTLAAGTPTFQSGPFPLSMIPGLPASQVNSGTFDPARLPDAVGVGFGHAPGKVPDPGTTGPGTDYLGRDINWHTAPSITVSYQTRLPTPSLSASSATGVRTVQPFYDTSVPINELYQDAIFFYAFTPLAVIIAPTSGFQEFPDVGYVSVLATDKIWVYAAHPGYNNSPFTNQPPPP